MSPEEFPGYTTTPYLRKESAIYPAAIPPALREIYDWILSAEWPVRIGLRASRISALDTLCRWQTLRAISYLTALARQTADRKAVEDLKRSPTQAFIEDPSFPGLMSRLEVLANRLPLDLLEPVVRNCTPLLEGGEISAFAVVTGLTEDSGPNLRQGIERAAALSGYWSASPELRHSMAITWSTHAFIHEWIAWSDRTEKSHSVGVGPHPRPDIPCTAEAPDWVDRFAARIHQGQPNSGPHVRRKRNQPGSTSPEN